MELFQAKDHYILQQGERALWCSRRDGGLQLRPATLQDTCGILFFSY
uniref:Inositol polyphosphate-5-phosphatase F n=1 Tax=Homo sapiens TaxID=9606 RepID=A0A3B3IU10_HUMAN